MMFDIETFVYIYVGVCVCMLLFNCFLIFYRRTEGVQLKEYTVRDQDIIEVQLQHIRKGESIDKKIQKRLQHKLKTPNQLQAFHSAITKKLETNELECREYLMECKQIFTILAIVYSKKNNMQKAYFAYIMSKYKICRAGEKNLIIDTMRQLVDHKSAYCRENALKALYSFGDEKNVFYALKLLNDSGIFHHKKLITDGLISFEGNHTLLVEMLWEQLSDFDLEFQVSFIDYIRNVSGEYREKFYSLMIKKGMHTDIIIAIIRYFGKYTYKPAQKVLLDYILNTENMEWQITAVAATILREYKDEDTLKALIQALSHQNWYVRFNAADSINNLGIGKFVIASIYNGDNRFAREILEFQSQRYRISENTKEEALAQ